MKKIYWDILIFNYTFLYLFINLFSMKKFLIKSIVFSFIFFTFGLIAFFLIKARSSTNPWTTDTQPNDLYVNSNETLTAAKRNTLASRNRVYDSGRFDVKPTVDTSASPDGTRNNYTINHNLWTDRLLIDVYSRSSSSATSFTKTDSYGQVNSSISCFWYIADNINSTSLTIKIRYSWCSYYKIDYTNTSWQYRVIVRTF